jgi:hypothetical protein
MIRERGPESFLIRTRNYWYRWVNKQEQDFSDLSTELIDIYKRSLLILRTQIDTMEQSSRQMMPMSNIFPTIAIPTCGPVMERWSPMP